MNGGLGKAIGRAAAFAASFTPLAASDLLVHCAQEMRHLATILPALHSAFGPNR
jgi:hypothetical protein